MPRRLLAVLALTACGAPPAPHAPPAVTRDGQRDFDFELGTWNTRLRRLVRPLTGSTEWVEYAGTTVVREVWAGGGNLVELDVTGPAGHIEALSLRLYNPATRQWSLNFAGRASGELSPPSIGSFAAGRGEFYSTETLGDRPILVRFVISNITATSVHFEQAFSADAGKTWEVNWIAEDTRMTPIACCPIVELRQYTLRDGQRDTLIELFDREFVESQELLGIRVIGQFRDRARPDRFVWMRGFDDMASRAKALGAFYGGPTWKAHRTAANATMIDSDNVLLLRPVDPSSGFALAGLARDPSRTAAPYAVTIYSFRDQPTAAVIEQFDRALPPGGARFVTETSANTFPALPVREAEHVFVVFGAPADPMTAFAAQLTKPPETLTLTPTARSLIGHR
ncbi:MAG: NIPSNAP family protein [Kofleriaceae bacterium]